jgi:group I intron endonuclease
MASGIYEIKNKITGQVYIGQSARLRVRELQHKRALNTNRHFNSKLQLAWNIYGADAFTFELLELIDDCNIDTEQLKKNLTDREQFYFNSYKSENLYNIIPPIYSALGIPNYKPLVNKECICTWCAKIYFSTGHRNKFCSYHCYTQKRHENQKIARKTVVKEQAICYCGNAFNKSTSIAKYCSQTCRDKRPRGRKNYGQPRPKYTFSCTFCAGQFESIAVPGLRFCSQVCKQEHRKKKS